MYGKMHGKIHACTWDTCMYMGYMHVHDGEIQIHACTWDTCMYMGYMHVHDGEIQIHACTCSEDYNFCQLI